MRLVFFKTPRPKQFYYRPRYYDEEKEKWEQKKKEMGLADESGETKLDFRAQMNRRWRQKHQDRTRKKTNQLSFLVYFAILAILIYFIFFV